MSYPPESARRPECVDCGRTLPRSEYRQRCAECEGGPIEPDSGPRTYVLLRTGLVGYGSYGRIGPWCGEQGRRDAEEFAKIHGGTVETEKGGNE